MNNDFEKYYKLNDKKQGEQYAEELVDSIINEKDILINLLSIKGTNLLTDIVREKIDRVDSSSREKISICINKLLSYFYCGNNDMNDMAFTKISTLDYNSKFLIKENLIYYIGRIGNDKSKELISEFYYKETNDLNKMNLAFSACLLGNQKIELDFISKVTPGSKWDCMIRSWTMAFFKDVDNPYDYKDSNTDDWANAKIPRINRLSINNENEKKYKKAMFFRLFDLTVIYMFCKSRTFRDLTESEYEIIERCISKPKFISKEKQEQIEIIKEKILNENNMTYRCQKYSI